MNDTGKKWLKSFIIGLIVFITGSSGIGALISNIGDVASGKPIQSVVKDVAVDTVKNKALDTLYGDSGDKESISSMFSKNKYKYVSDKKSGPIGYFAPGWYAEVYRIDNDAYIGNRKYNKATGVNMKWNMVNTTDFEIGDFKKNTAYNNSYVAYDSNSFKLVMGDMHKGKLNGYILVYDEYYNTYELIEYKKGKETGYKIVETDEKIVYYKKDKVKQEYNKTDAFKEIKDGRVNVKLYEDTNGYAYDFGNYTYVIDTENDYLEYKSDTIDFKGNAFAFDCIYKYDKEESVTYKFETMYKLDISCTDGTIGGVMVLDEADTSETAITAKSVSIALIQIGAHATVDVLIDGNLAMLDTAVEVATGQSISDRINYEIDGLIEDVFDEESELNQTIDNIGEAIEDISNPDDYRSWEDRIEDAFEDEEDTEDTSDMFNDSNKEVDENGEVYYTLPNGIKVTFGETENTETETESTEVSEEDVETSEDSIE